MKFYPTKIHIAFLCFVFLSILINFACSKDSDLLVDSILQEDSITSIEEKESSIKEEELEESVEEEISEEIIEIRTSSFSPIHDAHVQDKKGYNQNIIRLEEDHRTSYLMFDLSPIEVLNGKIIDATLQFTINSDDGSGTINVFKGSSNEWTENNLSDTTAPEIENELGSILKEYKIGTTELISLSAEQMTTEIITLILNHLGGNDLAFASKEHAQGIGPKLVITYSVPEGSEDILISEQQENIPEDNSNQEPMAVSDATPSSGGAPLEVNFTGSSSSDDNEISSYSWDFKDGSTSNEINPTHTFTEVGSYIVELSVIDNEGLTNIDTVIITVGENQNVAPKAVVSANILTGEAPLEISFNGSDSTDDYNVTSYQWDFKDGSTDTDANPKHTFTTPGEYSVTLTVTDEHGLTDEKSITITILENTNEAPVAVATATPSSGEAPLNVQFIGDKSTDDKSVNSYSWNFKDGSNATNKNPSHSFTQPGSYEVELTVSDTEGLTNTKTVTISVSEAENQAPVAIVTANKTSGEAPLVVQFIGDKSTDDKTVTTYAWDFKDGSTATNNNPSHTFNNPGNYIVDLTVKDAEGLSSTSSITINANEGISSNAPPGYYVSTTGNTSNDGKSPSKPWSIAHAFYTARSGDVVYVKAGNYGNVKLKVKNSGTSGNPISFIGYKDTPGDINSANGPTYTYNNYKSKGDNLDATKMPLLLGTRSNGIGSGKGIEIRQESNIRIENFMIAKHEYGIFNSGGNNNVFKNIITTDHGDFNPQNSWSLGNAPAFRNLTGVGIRVVSSNQVEIINSIAINNGARGLALVSSQNSKITNSSAYSDNSTNPTDYYIMVYGTTESQITNCHVERVGDLAHFGHGFSVKVDASYNQFKNCTTKGTSFELNNRVHHNTFTDCHVQGTGKALSGGWEVTNYSHDNTFISCSNDSGEGIVFSDWSEDDGNNGINTAAFNNTFKNCVITNVVEHSGAAIDFHWNNQAGRLTSYARDNTFDGCTFSGAKSLFKVDRVNSGNKLINCTISDIENLRHSRFSNNTGLPLGVSFQNTTTSNIGFTLPN